MAGVYVTRGRMYFGNYYFGHLAPRPSTIFQFRRLMILKILRQNGAVVSRGMI